MLLGDFPSGLLDLFGLFFEDVFRFVPELIDHSRVADVVGGITKRNRHDVQFGAGSQRQLSPSSAALCYSVTLSLGSSREQQEFGTRVDN